MNKTVITKDQGWKILRAAIYLGISTAIASLIAWLDGNPQSFGVWTPIINVILVTIKQLFTTDTESK